VNYYVSTQKHYFINLIQSRNDVIILDDVYSCIDTTKQLIVDKIDIDNIYDIISVFDSHAVEMILKQSLIKGRK